MRVVRARGGVSQPMKMVCGNITLHAAFLACRLSLKSWTSDDVAKVIQRGSKGRSLGSVFDEDYAREASQLLLDVKDQYIADGNGSVQLPDLSKIKDGTMMAFTTVSAKRGGVGHHNLLALQGGKWYFFESLSANAKGERVLFRGAGCLVQFDSLRECKMFLEDRMEGNRWSLRGIRERIPLAVLHEGGVCRTTCAKDMPEGAVLLFPIGSGDVPFRSSPSSGNARWRLVPNLCGASEIRCAAVQMLKPLCTGDEIIVQEKNG